MATPSLRAEEALAPGRSVVVPVSAGITLLSQSVVFQADPHPDLDSNFELFCQKLLAYLT